MRKPPPTLRERVLSELTKHGPQVWTDMVKKFNVPRPSMRRVCGTLAKQGEIVPVPSGKGPRIWGLSSDARNKDEVEPIAPASPLPDLTPVSPKSSSKKSPRVPRTSDGRFDWEATDFCF